MLTAIELASPSVRACVPWLAFAAVCLCAVVLYASPRRLSGPVTEAERRAKSGWSLRSVLRRGVAPALALVGLGLLLPPVDPPPLELTSWLVYAEPGGRRGLECLVPRLLEQAAHEVRVDGTMPRVALRHALLDVALELDDGECPYFAVPPMFDDADVESLELSLVMLAAWAQESREVEVEARATTGDFDPWQLLARGMSSRAQVSITVGRSLYGNGSVLAVDRAIAGPTGVELWIMLEHEVACDRAATLKLELAGGGGCDLGWTKPMVCESAPPSTLAVHARCTVPSGYDRPRLARLAGIEVHFDVPEPVEIRIVGDGTTWDDARAAAANNPAFVEDLAASGLALPQSNHAAEIELKLGEEEIHVEGRERCPEGPIPPAIENGGPFSWLDTGIEEPITADSGGIALTVGAAALDSDAEGYEATIFGATMRSVSWAAHCLRQCTCTTLRPPPRGGEPRPLLTQGEIDEAVARLQRPRDAVGVIFIATSLLMSMGWILAARRESP
jgi:hypothetical protein